MPRVPGGVQGGGAFSYGRGTPVPLYSGLVVVRPRRAALEEPEGEERGQPPRVYPEP
jgi:hypothetical protein